MAATAAAVDATGRVGTRLFPSLSSPSRRPPRVHRVKAIGGRWHHAFRSRHVPMLFDSPFVRPYHWPAKGNKKESGSTLRSPRLSNCQISLSEHLETKSFWEFTFHNLWTGCTRRTRTWFLKYEIYFTQILSFVYILFYHLITVIFCLLQYCLLKCDVLGIVCIIYISYIYYTNIII